MPKEHLKFDMFKTALNDLSTESCSIQPVALIKIQKFIHVFLTLHVQLIIKSCWFYLLNISSADSLLSTSTCALWLWCPTFFTVPSNFPETRLPVLYDSITESWPPVSFLLGSWILCPWIPSNMISSTYSELLRQQQPSFWNFTQCLSCLFVQLDLTSLTGSTAMLLFLGWFLFFLYYFWVCSHVSRSIALQPL